MTRSTAADWLSSCGLRPQLRMRCSTSSCFASSSERASYSAVRSTGRSQRELTSAASAATRLATVLRRRTSAPPSGARWCRMRHCSCASCRSAAFVSPHSCHTMFSASSPTSSAGASLVRYRNASRHREICVATLCRQPDCCQPPPPPPHT